MATCFVSLRIVRKIKKNAMDGIKGMHVCPEHKNVSTEQNILSTDQYEVNPPDGGERTCAGKQTKEYSLGFELFSRVDDSQK